MSAYESDPWMIAYCWCTPCTDARKYYRGKAGYERCNDNRKRGGEEKQQDFPLCAACAPYNKRGPRTCCPPSLQARGPLTGVQPVFYSGPGAQPPPPPTSFPPAAGPAPSGVYRTQMLAIGGAQGPGMPSGGKGAASSTGQLPAAAAERTSQVPAAAAAATREDMVHAEVGRLRRKVKILTDVLNDIILRNDLHVNPQLVQQLASISDDVAGSSAPPTSAPNNSGAPPTTTLAPLTVDSEMVES
jgi:hypothetical protein